MQADHLPDDRLLEEAGRGWQAWGASLQGARGENQDRLLVVRQGDAEPLLILADGAGGMAEGALAAELAVAAAAAAFEAGERVPAALVLACHAAVMAAPLGGAMASTLVLVWRQGPLLTGAHAGDSRLYALEAGTWVQVTRDHNAAEEAVRLGTLRPEDVAGDGRRHYLTRAAGALKPGLGPEEWTVEPAPTRALFCSDGLWAMARPECWQALAQAASAAEVRAAIALAAAEGSDNVSALVCSWSS